MLREAAEDSAHKDSSENTKLSERVKEVEEEMRSLLTIMEKQKQASSTKLEQLVRLVNDLKSPEV